MQGQLVLRWLEGIWPSQRPTEPSVHGLVFFRTYRTPSLAFEASTDPVDTSAQAALAPHQTTEEEESADKTFMEM
jgi:hypothetical protein